MVAAQLISQAGLLVALSFQGGQQATLRGVVHDSATGHPIAGVTVVLAPSGGATETTRSGRFTLGPFGPGEYEIRFEAHRYRERAFTIRIDSTLLRAHDIGRISLAPAESLAVDVSGLVHESAGATPVVGATVAVNRRVVGLTNFDGAFVGGVELPRGLNRLEVRATGFDPATADFWVDSTHISFDVPLVRRGLRLSDVVVEAEPGRGNLEQFYRHQDAEFGSFLDSAAVEVARRQYVTDILRAVPGVQILPGAYTVRMSRATGSRSCRRNQPQFFIDGHPLSLGMDISINDLLDEGDILAVEVYNSASRVPLAYAYGNFDCGVVAIWTKVPRR